jgi:hypothetical protein
MARYLFVVSREQPGLGDYMASHFADEPEVAVMLDRRIADRRRRDDGALEDRRRRERRVRPSVEPQLRAQDFALVVVG